VLTTPASIHVFLDDDTAPVVDAALTPSYTDTPRNLTVGLTAFSDDGWTLFIDDVTCEIR
jgi:hypothetical protein